MRSEKMQCERKIAVREENCRARGKLPCAKDAGMKASLLSSSSCLFFFSLLLFSHSLPLVPLPILTTSLFHDGYSGIFSQFSKPVYLTIRHVNFIHLCVHSHASDLAPSFSCLSFKIFSRHANIHELSSHNMIILYNYYRQSKECLYCVVAFRGYRPLCQENRKMRIMSFKAVSIQVGSLFPSSFPFFFFFSTTP